MKITIVNINYLDISKNTCVDNVKSASTNIIKQKRVYCKNSNNKSVHSKISYEISALLKIEKVSNTNIIIKKNLILRLLILNMNLVCVINLKRLLML